MAIQARLEWNKIEYDSLSKTRTGIGYVPGWSIAVMLAGAFLLPMFLPLYDFAIMELSSEWVGRRGLVFPSLISEFIIASAVYYGFTRNQSLYSMVGPCASKIV